MPKLSGNKGEWSEIYAFLRLLEIKKLYAADAELNKKDDMFYNIINIIRTEPIGTLEFRINRTEDTITVFNTSDSTELLTLPCSEFKNAADRLYCEIIETNASAFALPDTEEFLDTLNIGVLKAKSTDKADIRIKIHDINTGYETVQGFSIKSRLGSPSTLVNAGKTTNFVFEVTGNIDDAVVQEFNTCSKKFKDRFEVLDRNGCDISYDSMENDVFESNLQLIDGDLPKICGYMLKEYYSSGVNTVTNSLESLNVHNPIGYDLSKGHPFYEYKFKKFLAECALGMLPSKVWDGTADATGGYIIVREDGEVLCYHLFNRNEFETYLINNTKFETASTSRHEFGSINALDYIFKDLRDAFINAQINVFPQEPYEISPFDKSGDFTWGRLYQIYVSGSPKKIISNNINFISYKFSQITGNNHYSNKREVESLFESNNAKWILRYYNNDLSLNMNAFYAETFKIVSNIIQYKIPFYLTFYVSIFKLFMKKRSTNKISGSDFDINRLINIFEDGETSEEYSKLLDYGIPITTITKISNNKISIENLKKRNYDSKIFDEYEKIIIEETINLL